MSKINSNENNETDTNFIELDDISGLCRLCLCDDNDMISIYENINEEVNIFDELQRFSDVKLSKNHLYPSFICNHCLDLLNNCVKLRQYMQTAQRHLDIYFNMIKEQSEDERISEIVEDVTDENGCVEVISSKGKFPLKELLIVEDKNQNDDGAYSGFLKNLGTVISARFSNLNEPKNNVKEPAVEIVPLQEKELIHQKDSNLEESDFPITVNEEIKKPSSKEELIILKTVNNAQKPKTIKRRKKSKMTKKSKPNKQEPDHESFLCQTCGFLAEKKHQLKYHVQSKHSNQRHQCKICQKTFLWKHKLDLHMAVHNNERRFLCSVCGATFNYLSALIYHTRKHTGEKRYRCDYCPRSFSMSWGLTRHIRVHTGSKPFKCEQCSKHFASKSEVKCHMRVHTKEMPFRCHVCKKRFSKKENMKVHFFSHSGPARCSLCTKSFMDDTVLKMHYKQAHKVIWEVNIEEGGIKNECCDEVDGEIIIGDDGIDEYDDEMNDGEINDDEINDDEINEDEINEDNEEEINHFNHSEYEINDEGEINEMIDEITVKEEIVNNS